MNPPLILSILIVAAVSIPGCGHQTDAITAASAPQSAISPRESQMPRLTPIDGVGTLSKDSLEVFERKCGCQLPDDYRSFLLLNNGGFPSPDCVQFEEGGKKTAADVFCFLAIDDNRPGVSLEWHYETYSGRLPKSTLPIARDSSGNLWLLNLGTENTGSIYFWDHGSYDTFDETDLANWPLVARNFREFRDSLSTFDASALSEGVPNRYTLVKQATDAMAKRDAGFSARTNPGYVWHCDCDEGGHVKMQFVKYEVHAVTTHTCGYTRLRAIKGLIKGGQTRLPH